MWSIFKIFLLFALLIIPFSVSADITTGLIGHWNFDEGSGTAAGDISGNGNTGAISGSGFSWVSGKIRGALSFDGKSNYVETQSIASQTNFSLTFWIKTVASDGTVFDWAGRFCRLGGVTAGKINCTVDNSSSSQSAVSAATLNDNQWHSVVFAVSGNTQTLYVDGVQNSVSSKILAGSNASLRIGRFSGGSTGYFSGAIDDVRFYNRSLSLSDASDIYANMSSATVVSPSTSVLPVIPPVSTSNPPTSQVVVNPQTTPSVKSTYTVKQDGTGDFSTIQACANVLTSGSTCLVYPGTYPEHVVVKNGGSDDAHRVVFKSSGLVSMRGFDIPKPYVTIDGFDITGAVQYVYSGYITVMRGADYCQLLNNTIHDGVNNEYGISFPLSGGVAVNNCLVHGNLLDNLNYQFLGIDGSNHMIEGNVLRNLNGWDAIRFFGHDNVFRRNVVTLGVPKPNIGNHPDFVQTFPDDGGESYNMLFEQNWIENIDSQVGQINSGSLATGISSKFHDYTFRGNVFANISSNMSIDVPGVVFDHNTFYKTSYLQTGLNYSSSLTRGDASRGRLTSNAFVEGGMLGDTNGTRGFYSNVGAALIREVLVPVISDSGTLESVYTELKNNQYIGPNGEMLAKTKALSDISQFTLSSMYSAYKSGIFDRLVKTNQLDQFTYSTFINDYNFVAGGQSENFPSKKTFKEVHGVNGGNPQFKNAPSPMGPDGIPFTLDDGFKPLTGSPLCGKGENGTDIGAYSCNASIVFASPTSGSSYFAASGTTSPVSLPIISPSPTPGSCSPSLNQCTSGTFSDTTDSSTQSLWSCIGQNGGATASCSASLSSVATSLSLSINKSGTGSGTVSGGSISCSSSCSQVVSPGTSIALSASPSSDSTFTGWSGACTGTGECTVSMTANVAVTAQFTLGSTTSVLGCASNSGFSTVDGTPCDTPIPTTTTIPGCNGTTIFSITTGKPCTGQQSSSFYNLGTVTLRNGSRGEAVKELQRFLNDTLHLGLVLDGRLGPKTISVIKQWQRDNSLVPDGLVGAKTKGRINSSFQ